MKLVVCILIFLLIIIYIIPTQTPLVAILILIVIIGEGYYWVFWLPKHWKEVPDAVNIKEYLDYVRETKKKESLK